LNLRGEVKCGRREYAAADAGLELGPPDLPAPMWPCSSPCDDKLARDAYSYGGGNTFCVSSNVSCDIEKVFFILIKN
jgi:hypothetical protein